MGSCCAVKLINAFRCLCSDSLPVLTEFLQKPCERGHRWLRVGQRQSHSWSAAQEVASSKLELGNGPSSGLANSPLNLPPCAMLSWKAAHMCLEMVPVFRAATPVLQLSQARHLRSFTPVRQRPRFGLFWSKAEPAVESEHEGSDRARAGLVCKAHSDLFITRERTWPTPPARFSCPRGACCAAALLEALLCGSVDRGIAVSLPLAARTAPRVLWML